MVRSSFAEQRKPLSVSGPQDLCQPWRADRLCDNLVVVVVVGGGRRQTGAGIFVVVCAATKIVHTSCFACSQQGAVIQGGPIVTGSVPVGQQYGAYQQPG